MSAGRQTWAIVGENRLVQSVPSSGVVTFSDASLSGPQDVTVVKKDSSGYTSAVTVVGYGGSDLRLAPKGPQASFTTLHLSGTITNYSNWAGLSYWASAPGSGGGQSSMNGGSFSLQISVPTGTAALDLYAIEKDLAGKLSKAALVRGVAPNSATTLALQPVTGTNHVRLTNTGLYAGTAKAQGVLTNGAAFLFATDEVDAAPDAYISVPDAAGSYLGLTKFFYGTAGDCNSRCGYSKLSGIPYATWSSTVEILPPVTVTSPPLGTSSAPASSSLATLRPTWTTPVSGNWIAVSLYRDHLAWTFFAPPSAGSVKPFTLPAPLPALTAGAWYVAVSSNWTESFVSYDALFSASRTGWEGLDRRTASTSGYVNLY